MNNEQILDIAEAVASAHHALCAASYGYRHGTRDWGDVAEAIRREGDAIGRLSRALPPMDDPGSRLR